MMNEKQIRELLVVWQGLRSVLSGKSRMSFFVDGYIESLEQVLAGGKE